MPHLIFKEQLVKALAILNFIQLVMFAQLAHQDAQPVHQIRQALVQLALLVTVWLPLIVAPPPHLIFKDLLVKVLATQQIT